MSSSFRTIITTSATSSRRRARSIGCGCLETFEFANERPLLLLGSTSKNAILRAFLRFNIREDRLVPNDLVYISPEANESKLAKSKLRADDVLIVRTGYPGTSCVVPIEYDGANCIDLVFARPHKNILRSSFLSRFLNSNEGKKQALKSKTGLAQQHLNVGAVKKTWGPVPTLSEQDRIVEILTNIDRKLLSEENRQRSLSVLFQSLLSSLMTGKVRVPLNIGQPTTEAA